MFKVVDAIDMQYVTSSTYTLVINITDIVATLINDFELISNFNSFVEDSSCVSAKVIIINILEKMLHLYLRVRTFLLAKDMSEKYGIKNKLVKL